MIRAGELRDYCAWSHTNHMRELYRARARNEVEEMTCAAQAAGLLADKVREGESLLDAGCGSGWFYHSLRSRGLALDYWGMDQAPSFISIGREELPAFGLPVDRLIVGNIEYAEGQVDHVLCMNVLSNIDNWHRSLDRLTALARRTVILRESITDGARYSYVTDHFLDPGTNLKVHVNAYDRGEIVAFLSERGFAVSEEVDRRTGGKPELVIGYPHHWTFLVAERIEEQRV